jgi:antitoxin HicB
MIQYQAKVYKDGRGYSVEFPDLAGCFSAGPTKERALENAREALSLFLEDARDPEWKLPTPRTRKGSRYVWVTPTEDVAIPLMIRRLRQTHRLSQRQLAKRLRVTVQQLQKLETPGKSNPTIRTLAAISNAVGEELEVRLMA